jgi:sugar phosphate isomerase/epimerase
MEFAFVTDELDREEPRAAIEAALEWGVTRFEIRNAYGARFPKQESEGLDELAALREEYAITYTAVSPGFFKCHLNDEQHIAYALGDGLDITMEFMEGCDIPLLVCFGFEMATGTDDEAVALLQRMADRLGEHRLQGAVENETHCKFDTPARIAALLDRVDRPNLGANWDLGNLQEHAPDAIPEGYDAVKPYIVNVHAKDVVLNPEGNAWTPIGDGVCDWAGQVNLLQRDRIVEHITIENHVGPLLEVGKRNLDLLRAMVASAAE